MVPALDRDPIPPELFSLGKSMPQKKGNKSSFGSDIAKLAILGNELHGGARLPSSVEKLAKGPPSKKGGKNKKPPPGFFSDIGEVLGTVAGGAINGFTGKNIVKGMNQGAKSGRAIGGHVATITGFGDYHVSANSLGNKGGEVYEGNQTPQFANSGKNTIVRKVEYIQDMVVDTALQPFDATFSEVINPANVNLFPWLSRMAPLYQKYRFRGLVFHFKSTSSEYSADVALGAIVMATNYNVNDSPFQSKMEMEQSDYCVSTKPSKSILHPIECDPATLGQVSYFIRAGVDPATVEDNRLYDIGRLTVAMAGIPASADAASLGELWVSYEVELIEPYISPADNLESTLAWFPTGVSAASGYPFGNTQPTYNPGPNDTAAGPTIMGSGIQWESGAYVDCLKVPKLYFRKGCIIGLIVKAEIPEPALTQRPKGFVPSVDVAPTITQPYWNGMNGIQTVLVEGYVVTLANNIYTYYMVQFVWTGDGTFYFNDEGGPTPTRDFGFMNLALPSEVESEDGAFQSVAVWLAPGTNRFSSYSALSKFSLGLPIGLDSFANHPGFRRFKPYVKAPEVKAHDPLDRVRTALTPSPLEKGFVNVPREHSISPLK